jgi:hypothetical protein
MGKIINNALRHRHATGRACMHLNASAFFSMQLHQTFANANTKCFCMLLDRLENG